MLKDFSGLALKYKNELLNNVIPFAEHGAQFLEKYGHDKNSNWYFSLNREGRPLVAPYNIFSDCFATMGRCMQRPYHDMLQ